MILQQSYLQKELLSKTKNKLKTSINFYVQNDLELSPRYDHKERISEIELSKKSNTPHRKRSCQRHIGENIYILGGLVCIKCLKPTRTSVSPTLGKTAKIIFKMDNLPINFG